jgi:predicted O-linked N-acetylglucosamine transferase (SPINDLY family)
MHKKYAQQFERTIARFAPAPMRNWQVDSQTGSHRPIRIGYVSPDFRQHAVANFIEPVLVHHDKSKFELFCYSNQPVGDEVTVRMQTLVPNWRVIANMSEHDAARKIQEDQIDILVDLAGHTNQNSLMVFARKPAPVQATWLGYVNTTGLSSIDYRISDVLSEPPEIADEIYSEKLVRLPDCFTCFLPLTKSPDVGPLPAQQSGEIMFGSFNYFVN